MIKNNKGVTLVELLIVIVILGIIAAVSIPAVGSIVDNSQRDAVIAEASAIKSAASTCVAAGECEYNANGWVVEVTGGDITDYITSSNSYAVNSNGAVFVQVGDIYFFGNPTTASRSNVVDVPDTAPLTKAGLEADALDITDYTTS